MNDSKKVLPPVIGTRQVIQSTDQNIEPLTVCGYCYAVVPSMDWVRHGYAVHPEHLGYVGDNQ